MDIYEVAILYDPDLEVDLSKAEDRVKKIFTDNKGEVKSVDNWGKRKLAYKIKNNEHAIYAFYQVQLPPESVQKVEAALNITDEVIRFLITKPDLKAMAKAEAKKKEKEELAAKHADVVEETDDTEEE